MYAEYVRKRIAEFQTLKGISDYRLSKDLEHCLSYMHDIRHARALPSMAEFFRICAYLGITPVEFFACDPELSEQKQKAILTILQMDETDCAKAATYMETLTDGK